MIQRPVRVLALLSIWLWSLPPVAMAGCANSLTRDTELKKLLRGVVADSSGQHTTSHNALLARDGSTPARTNTVPSAHDGFKAARTNPPPTADRHAVMVALAESMGYGGERAVDDLRATLGSINNDMASLPPAMLADSFARTIAGALSLTLGVAPLPTEESSGDIIVHAVGAAEGREGAALEHMAAYLSAVDFGDIQQQKTVRIVMIGPEWSESSHKRNVVLPTDNKRVGAASVLTYRGLYNAETLRDLALPPPTVVICFNCDIYHCHWRPSLLFMLAQGR